MLIWRDRRFYPASYPATIVQVKHHRPSVFNKPGRPGDEESGDVFTGLVEGLGRLEQVIPENGGRRLTIAWPGLPAADPLQLGESVAVSGCCLTVVAATGETFEIQAGPETLDRTNLGTRRAGDRVNLERALKVGARMGGHFVQGHIDPTATLRD